MSRRAIARIYAKFSVKQIATRAGVSTSTARRWRRKGEIPETHREAIESLKRLKTYSASELLRKSPEQIAALTGRTLRTVKAWKRRGTISENTLKTLTHEKLEEPKRSRKKITLTERKEYRGHFTEGVILECRFSPMRHLSRAFLAEAGRVLASEAPKKIKGRRPTSYQYVVIGETRLAYDEELGQKYGKVVLQILGEPTDDEEPDVIAKNATYPTTNSRTLEGALDKLFGLDLPADLDVHTITLFVRRELTK